MTEDLQYDQIPIDFSFYTKKTLDNFIIGAYKNGFNIIVNNLLDDRSRFYSFVPYDFIKIDLYLAAFVFIFLIVIYNSKNYSIVNELDLALEKSIFDEYFYIFLIWSTSFLSFLQLFRFTSVSVLITIGNFLASSSISLILAEAVIKLCFIIIKL